jgi:hypothetical protein
MPIALVVDKGWLMGTENSSWFGSGQSWFTVSCTVRWLVRPEPPTVNKHSFFSEIPRSYRWSRERRETSIRVEHQQIDNEEAQPVVKEEREKELD